MQKRYRGPDLEVPEESLPQAFFRTVEKYPDGAAIRYRGADGAWVRLTWREAEAFVRRVAGGLLSMGVEPGDRVAILADTRWEWTAADLGTLSTGAVVTTIYPTLTPGQVEYLLNDSGSKVVFVEDQEQFDKLAQVADKTPAVERYVTFEDVDAGDLAKRTVSLEALAEEGDAYAEAHPGAVDARVADIDAHDRATIIYTSGTTGLPKGCILTHYNFVGACEGVDVALGHAVGPDDVGMAFLPLAHSYQRMNTFFVMRNGAEGVFTTPADLGEDLKEVEPTLMASVPRLYEKMYDAVLDKVGEAPEKRQKIFHKASDVAREYGKAISNAGKPGLVLRFKHWLYDKLVYSKLRANLGAERLRYVFTGSAAIRADLMYWFRGVGVPILEGYGLTETSAPSNINLPGRFKPGTVGPPMPGVEQRISDEGEVQMRGPQVFKEYYELPEETEAAFTEDGWFRSGDLGEFDEDGFLRIIDRLKEIEVQSTGKNVAPVPIEEAIKADDHVNDVLVVASDRKFTSALIQPNYEAILKLARKEGVEFDEDAVVTVEDPAGNPMVVEVPQALVDAEPVQRAIQAAVDKANEEFANFEQVKRFRLVTHAFTISRDELTPTLKKKRRNIKANWGDLIDSMYPEG